MLHDYVWYEIFYYLTNEDIYKLNQINRYFNNLVKDEKFFNIIMEREHPLVFNRIDNLCNKCNLGIFILDDDTKYIICNHL